MQDKFPWIAVTLLALAILVHALVPRYEISIHGSDIIRVDRWTGQMEGGRATNLRWVKVPTVWDEVDKVLATPPATTR